MNEGRGIRKRLGRRLLVVLHTHECRVMFFIAVELDALAVVSPFGKGFADVLLLFFGDDAKLLLDVVIGGRAEALHDAQPDGAQVGGAHVVEDAGDTPCVAFLAVGHEERARLSACYHVGIGCHITISCVLRKHFVGGVAQAFVCFFAMRTGAMDEVGI